LLSVIGGRQLLITDFREKVLESLIFTGQRELEKEYLRQETVWILRVIILKELYIFNTVQLSSFKPLGAKLY
jgi:hypothetical protein